MQLSLSLLAFLASAAAKQNGDSSVTRGFLGKGTRLQPDVVAHSLSEVEEEWKDMAIAFVECNQTLSDAQDMAACTRAPNAFQKSCTTVVNSVFKASNGDRDNVQEYMSEVCEQSALTGWKKDNCHSLASNIVNAMSLNAFDNRQRLSGSGLCKKFWSQFQLEEQTRLEKERIQQEAIEAKEAQARAEAEKKAAEERAAAEKKRIEQEAIAAKKAEAAEKKRIEQEAAAKKEAEARAQAEQKAASERAANEKKTAVKKVSAKKDGSDHAAKKEGCSCSGKQGCSCSDDKTKEVKKDTTKKAKKVNDDKKDHVAHNATKSAQKKANCTCSKKSRDDPCECED